MPNLRAQLAWMSVFHFEGRVGRFKYLARTDQTRSVPIACRLGPAQIGALTIFPLAKGRKSRV
jgi:hypothetical protein